MHQDKIRKEHTMATNPPSGDNHRNGAIRGRSQFKNPINDTWYKRDKTTGQILDGKADGSRFKGVRREDTSIR